MKFCNKNLSSSVSVALTVGEEHARTE